MNGTCVFCKIVRSEIPSYRVYDDKHTIGFLDINPSAPGHSIVILKEHGLSILDYSEKELEKLLASTKRVAKKLKKVLNYDSLTIGINHLERRGVPHLHIHLIPRWENDGGGIIQSVVNNPPKEKLDILSKKIREA